MKRLLVLTLIATVLSTACATTQKPETESLVDDILKGQSAAPSCSEGVPYCIARGTRIHNTDRTQKCGCSYREGVSSVDAQVLR